MDLSIFKYSFCGLGIAFLLCGCASYRVKPLRKLTKETAQYCQEKDGVQLCASRIESQEFKSYTNGKNFLERRQLVPVLVTVYNNGANDLIWRAQETKLTLLSADEAVRFLFYGFGAVIPVGIGSALGFSLGGFAIMQLAHVSFYSRVPMVSVPMGILGAGSYVALTGAVPLAACVMVSAYYGHRAFNNMLVVDMRDKILSRVDLAPGDSVSKLLITHKDELEKPFVLNMRAIGTNKITEFVVDLSVQGHNHD